MKLAPNNLIDLFLLLRNYCMTDYAYGFNTLRLQINSPDAAPELSGFAALQVVLEDCTFLNYVSYTQTHETRTVLENPEEIFSQKLMIQGLEKQLNNQYILYCTTCQDKIQAGELRFTATGFRLYDQEFGRLNFQDFCKTAE